MGKEQKNIIYSTDLCIFCGAEVPEGRMLCFNCENGCRDDKSNPPNSTHASGGSEDKKIK